MRISATIENSFQKNEVRVETEGAEKGLNIPGKATGYGSGVNGGEMLFLALATCFCNDIYREAAKRGYDISSVRVSVSGKFGKEGEPGFDIQYSAKVESAKQSREEIDALIRYVDEIAEVHNTLRRGATVSLVATQVS